MLIITLTLSLTLFHISCLLHQLFKISLNIVQRIRDIVYFARHRSLCLILTISSQTLRLCDNQTLWTSDWRLSLKLNWRLALTRSRAITLRSLPTIHFCASVILFRRTELFSGRTTIHCNSITSLKIR